MQTVFSHIIQKRFSQENENIATDALAFILNSSESARHGMMKLLRGIIPTMPDLQFQTQQSKDNIRPDMWGYDDNHLRVFIENKFWAGLTENQPISYLRELSESTASTILLFIVPSAREQMIIRELHLRLDEAKISRKNNELTSSSLVSSVTTDLGPVLAITSWDRLLSLLDLEMIEDSNSKSDLLQLKALCQSADTDAFLPISSEKITDQRDPAFILQLNTIIQDTIQKAVNQKFINLQNLKPQASWDRIGRYARFEKSNIGIWFGTHFVLWKEYGNTPIWMIFSNSNDFGRAQEVKNKLETWAAQEGIFIQNLENGDLAVAIDLKTQEEKDRVEAHIVEQFKNIYEILADEKYHIINGKGF